MGADRRLCDAGEREEDVEQVDPDRRQRAGRVEHWQLAVVVPLFAEECETGFTMTLGVDAGPGLVCQLSFFFFLLVLVKVQQRRGAGLLTAATTRLECGA